MDVVALIGRILFGLLFLVSSVAHLTQTDAMAGYVASRGVPAAKIATLASGVLILAGGLMVIVGLWADLGALFLVAFLLSTSFGVHAFWTVSDAQGRQMEMTQFTKDLALAGAALIVFAVFVKFGDQIGLTITGPLFD